MIKAIATLAALFALAPVSGSAAEVPETGHRTKTDTPAYSVGKPAYVTKPEIMHRTKGDASGVPSDGSL